MKHFLYATLVLSVFAMCASAVELQDVDKTTTMYSVGDPFGLAQLATRVGTQELNVVSAQVNATNSLFMSYFNAIWPRTNNWNSAYSWGNHAGLYRDILWVPAWSEVTNKPTEFTPSAHNQAWATITNPPTYIDQSGTSQYAVAAGVVTGAQSGVIASALQPNATNSIPHGSLSGVLGAGALHVSATETGRIDTAWVTGINLTTRIGTLETNNFVEKLYTTSHAQYIDGQGQIWQESFTTNSILYVTNAVVNVFEDSTFVIDSEGATNRCNERPLYSTTENNPLYWRLRYDNNFGWTIASPQWGDVQGYWFTSETGENLTPLPNVLIPYSGFGTFTVELNNIETNYNITTNFFMVTDRLATTTEVAVVNARVTVHTNRTDNPHAGTSAQVGALSTNGGTVVGSVYSTVDHTTMAPANDELITGAFVRSLLSFGKAAYMTTNLYTALWQPTNTTGIASYDNPVSNLITFTVGAVGSYVATMVDTNIVASGVPLQGPSTVHIHLGIASGSPVANYSLSVAPEIYYTYSLAATNLTLGDFSADAQTWTSGQNVGKGFAIAWSTVYPTNAYYRVYRLKVVAKGSAITSCTMGVGGTDSSYITYQTSGEEASAVQANLDTHNASATAHDNRFASYALAENVVTGAVCTVTSGNRYFWTTATNVTLTASLTGGQVVNYVALRNTATNEITAVCESATWKFTGGSLTNTLPASTMMTFGWSCNPFTGATNFYATAASSN